MSNNNVEVEIKVPVDENAFLKLRDKLNNIAKFVETLQQKDKYFVPAHRDFLEPKFPFEWLSIRKRGDRNILNYKHWHPENVELSTHCDEFETEIINPLHLEKIFSVLNIKELVTVEKEREVFTYNDEFEIALDTVKELGHFIEIESMKDFGSIEATREKIIEFAKTLGIDTSKLDKGGYPLALMEKKGLLKTC
jgi:predicted adenylyl cyclase CyaB